jgi:hypothetical protein
MSSHTPEPWIVRETDGYSCGRVVKSPGWIISGPEYTVFHLPNAGRMPDSGAADAARIVACVNACAGMDDPAAALARLRERVAELERDAALNASAREVAGKAMALKDAEDAWDRAMDAEIESGGNELNSLQDAADALHASIGKYRAAHESARKDSSP